VSVVPNPHYETGAPIRGLLTKVGHLMHLITVMSQFVRDERALETVEWAVMGALIAVGLLATVVTIGTQVMNKFTALQAATT